ncbi:MAG: response regulator [Candidatus Omnitrophica bacterium]|nr:response regulator [Candidatus Omnitrophota bacterium]
MTPPRRRILLVDDEPLIVQTVGRQLEAEGFEVLTAMDGEDALVKVRTGRPDLLILDLMMPKLSGIKVCVALKRDQLYQQIPIIIMTAKGDLVDAQACKDCGADAFLEKPCRIEDIMKQVRTLLP